MHASHTASIIRKFAAGAFLAATTLASAGAASAAPKTEPVTMRFEFDRADTAKVTYGRLQRQAARTCDVQGATITSRASNPCVAELIEKAVTMMGDARIAQLHGERTAGRATQVASR